MCACSNVRARVTMVHLLLVHTVVIHTTVTACVCPPPVFTTQAPKQWRQQGPSLAGTGPHAGRAPPLTTIQSPAVRDQLGTELLELDKCTLGRHWCEGRFYEKPRVLC